MSFRRAVGPIGILLALSVFSVHPTRATVRYSVSFDHPEKHLFHVTMTIPIAESDREIVVQMPAWNALYQVRDFSYRVRDLRELSRGLPEKVDKQTWRLHLDGSGKTSGVVTLSYSIYWDDTGPFNSQLNPHHAFMNLAESLMYLPNRRSEDTRVQFTDIPPGWNVIAELPAGDQPNSFAAPSYDALVDAPVEAGKYEEFEFDSAGAHFRVVVDAANWNRGHLQDALERITKYEIQLMGGPPFREYTFFFHIGPETAVGEGGMEHANSTTIADVSLDGAVSIAAHEFFHVWNVKRIRPRSLEPVDYTKEQYTRALWFAEGVTDTYSSFTLVRTGLWSRKQFYGDLASQIEAVESRPAHVWQSAEESSLDAWYEKYDGYNVPDRSISYYDKGQSLGVLLDLAIRDATDNRKSLDDVFRLMNDEYAKQGKFYDDTQGVRAAVEQVAGKNFRDFFDRYVSGVEEIPYNDFLGLAGLEIKTDGNISISEIPHPTDRQRRIRDGLLRGSTD